MDISNESLQKIIDLMSQITLDINSVELEMRNSWKCDGLDLEAAALWSKAYNLKKKFTELKLKQSCIQ